MFRHKTIVRFYMLIKSELQIKDVIGEGSNRYRIVRDYARTILKKYENVCQKCGYDVHVEVCHLKAISDFPVDTLLSVVNSEDNLLLLCRNCHWELDNQHKYKAFDLTLLKDKKISISYLIPTERKKQQKVNYINKFSFVKNPKLIKKSKYSNCTEIHKLLWNMPATEVAKHYNISSSGLKRICKRRGIPTPPRGFWSCYDFGKLKGQSCPLPNYDT